MNPILQKLDSSRQKASKEIDTRTKSSYGQFLTPSRIAEFMSSLFTFEGKDEISILDPGAGIGSLSIALLDRILSTGETNSISWTGYEIDTKLFRYLQENINELGKTITLNNINFSPYFIIEDYLVESVKQISSNRRTLFDFIIINPPYKKILRTSKYRLLLRTIDIETVNLYTAFLTVSIELLNPNGQIVAIIPRSFCNGPYYKSFRKFLISKTNIQHIHSFISRDKAFREDDVLQENIIIHLKNNGEQGNVKISFSEDSSFKDMTDSIFPFSMIVKPDDSECFIHIPTQIDAYPRSYGKIFGNNLSDLGISVSTGPIVDFRATEYLSKKTFDESIPLIYPFNFGNIDIEWPRKNKKPNAIVFDNSIKNQLFPKGYYVVTRRFSSKEEPRRIYANVVNPLKIKSELITFENHLNFYHINRGSISKEIAYGLAIYLNSTYLDQQFRQFSGHTQVNVTDLKLLKYPSLQILKSIGVWGFSQIIITQESIDREVNKYAIS